MSETQYCGTESEAVCNWPKDKIELGKDQILWLNTYRTINLEQWICDFIDKKPDWLYVGDWSLGPIKPHGKGDGGYAQRHRNLKSNRYF